MKFSELRPGDLVIWRCDDGTSDADLVVSMGHVEPDNEQMFSLFFITMWGNRRPVGRGGVYRWYYREHTMMSARAVVVKADSLNT